MVPRSDPNGEPTLAITGYTYKYKLMPYFAIIIVLIVRKKSKCMQHKSKATSFPYKNCMSVDNFKG